MNADEKDRWQRLSTGSATGDARIVAEFATGTARAAPRRGKAPGGRRALCVGPEDVVQSACRTFLRPAGAVASSTGRQRALWRLPARSRSTRPANRRDFTSGKRRGLDRETPLAPPPGESGATGIDAADPNPTPAEAAEFADFFQQCSPASTTKSDRWWTRSSRS